MPYSRHGKLQDHAAPPGLPGRGPYAGRQVRACGDISHRGRGSQSPPIPPGAGRSRRPSRTALPWPGLARLMATKHPKRPRDPNQLGKLIVDLATGVRTEERPNPPTPSQEFARSGGLKGGAARAKALSPERRAEIARKAAAKRWARD